MSGFQDKIMVVIDATSKGAVQEMDRLKKSTKEADLGVAALGKTLKAGLVAGAAAFAGAGLVTFLNDSVNAFVQAQTAAEQFARATNATIVEAGKFTTVARSMGLEMNDLIEINAEFSRKIQEQPGLLRELNVEIAKNADGSTNMTKTLVQTLDALGQMEDGLKAAQIAAQLFGEEGSKQLAGFYLQGIKVSDLMERINFIDQSKEAKEFAAATIELNLAWEEFRITIGSKLAPVLTDVVDILTEGLDVLDSIPPALLAATAAMGVFGFAAKKALGSEWLQSVKTAQVEAQEAWKNAPPITWPMPSRGTEEFDLWMADVNKNLDSWEKAHQTRMQRFTAYTDAAVSAIGGFNLALIGLTAVTVAYGAASASFDSQIRSNVARLEELERQGTDAGKALKKTAAEIEASSNVLQDFFAAYKGKDKGDLLTSLALGPLGALRAAVDAFRRGGNDVEAYSAALGKSRDEARKLAEATGSAAVATLDLKEAQDQFNNAVADYKLDQGVKNYEALIRSAKEYSEALREQERMERLAKEALAAVDIKVRFDLRRDNIDVQLEAYDLIEKVKEAATAVGTITADTPTVTVAKINLEAEAAILDLEANWREQLENGTITQAQYILNLQNLKLVAPNLGPQIDGIIAQITGGDGKGVNVPVNADTSKASANVNGLKVQVDDLTAYRAANIDVNTKFSPGGYEAVKARKDYLVQDRNGSIGINVSFGPGGYEAVKARKDYLTQDRTSTITFRTVGLEAARAAAQSIQQNSLGAAAGQAAASANMMFSPINMVRVSLDGRELRSVIDDEIRALTPTRQEVA